MNRLKNVTTAQADIDGNFNGHCRGNEKLGVMLIMCVTYNMKKNFRSSFCIKNTFLAF